MAVSGSVLLYKTRTLFKIIFIFILWNALMLSAAAQDEITLLEALALSEENNLQLKSLALQTQAVQQEQSQANVRNNPQLAFEGEDILGSGSLRGIEGGAFTFSLAQEIQLGGTRRKGSIQAEAVKELSDLEYELQRNDFVLTVIEKYLDAFEMQEMGKAIDQFVSLAQEGVRTAKQRMTAGTSNEAELAKARVALAQIVVRQKNIELAKQGAFRSLSILWGERIPNFVHLQSVEHHFPSLPALDKLLSKVKDSPGLQVTVLELNAARARLDVEKSKKVPNLTVGAGIRHLSETGDTGLVAGLSMPLSIFDRNQGNIAASKSRHDAAKLNVQSEQLIQESELQNLWYQASSLSSQLLEFENTIVPQTKLAFDTAQALFQNGRYGYLDLLDAQRTLFEQQQNQINILASYYRSYAKLEALLGLRLSELN